MTDKITVYDVEDSKARAIFAHFGLSDDYKSGRMLSEESTVKMTESLAQSIFHNIKSGEWYLMRARLAVSRMASPKGGGKGFRFAGTITLFIPNASLSKPNATEKERFKYKKLFAFPIRKASIFVWNRTKAKATKGKGGEIEARIGKHFFREFPNDLPGSDDDGKESEFSGEVKVTFVDRTELNELFENRNLL